ncbi:zf-PARP-domain-containing protein [Gonapodya prolifera JEL478]|uniref:Zf-PARP-domain-containing protein n=1 Tax=Gonapodya prolifera (strain JEL478) TaxID=1344416 RepID=A0A139AE61_GONPJ|nr:zf-PARP-domain-containing protein [Gonapodya prolifera JEL478]|eukprot:KXS15081.1 zf-PARP-domain-containing protein [Gonapodya prolifera JEL478]
MSEPTYIIEYAATGRAKCKGPKSCLDKTISKGDLRFGTQITIQDHPGMAWRHWSCVTATILSKIKSVDDVTGLDTLSAEDQVKVRSAIEAKINPEQDQLAVAAKAASPAKPKPAKPPKRKKKDTEDADDDGDEMMPAPRKRATKKAAAAEKSDDE